MFRLIKSPTLINFWITEEGKDIAVILNNTRSVEEHVNWWQQDRSYGCPLKNLEGKDEEVVYQSKDLKEVIGYYKLIKMLE